MAYSMIRSCPACGARNRVPAAHLASGAVRCGRCKTPLGPVAEPLEVGEEGFTEIIGSAGVPVLVDFWAAWCGPCRMAAPQVAAVARDLAGQALVLKVDTEAHPELAARFQVQAIPYFVVLRDGKVVRQQPGLVPADVMRGWLDAARA